MDQNAKQPGQVIRALLEDRGWTQTDLARILGRPIPTVNEIIQGKRAIMPEMAMALAAAFGKDAQFWLALEVNRQLAFAEDPGEEVRKRAMLFEMAPIKEMEKRGWINRTTTADELECELRRFYRCDDLSKPPSLLLSTRRTTVNPEEELTPIQRAWGFRALNLASSQITAPFNPDDLDECTAALRKLAAFAPEVRKVPNVLNKYGIRFAVIEPLPGAKIDGAAFWIDDDKPAIVLSIRHDRIDGFWHTLFHELAHIRYRDGLSVDSALVGDDAAPTAVKTPAERRADKDAADKLIPADKLQSFIHRVAPLYSRDRIIQFAHRIKIHPGIIVGQLQHRGEIGFHANRDLLVKVRDTAISVGIVDGWGHIVT